MRKWKMFFTLGTVLFVIALPDMLFGTDRTFTLCMSGFVLMATSIGYTLLGK